MEKLTENLTKKDLDSQNELIIEAIQTIVVEVNKQNALLYTDTQRRLIEIENNFRGKIQDHEERIIRLEERDKSYMVIQKYGVKIFSIITVILVILWSIFRKPN